MEVATEVGNTEVEGASDAVLVVELRGPPLLSLPTPKVPNWLKTFTGSARVRQAATLVSTDEELPRGSSLGLLVNVRSVLARFDKVPSSTKGALSAASKACFSAEDGVEEEEEMVGRPSTPRVTEGAYSRWEDFAIAERPVNALSERSLRACVPAARATLLDPPAASTRRAEERLEMARRPTKGLDSMCVGSSVEATMARMAFETAALAPPDTLVFMELKKLERRTRAVLMEVPPSESWAIAERAKK